MKEQNAQCPDRKIVIECYQGVYMKEVLSHFGELSPALFVDTRRLFKSSEEIERMTEPYMTDNVLFGYCAHFSYADFLDKGKVEIEGNVNDVKRSYTKGNALLIEVSSTQDTAGDIVARLAHSFQVTSKSLKQGHLFLEISDDAPSSYAASMQKALRLLDGYEVYQCQRKMVSMEEIFINLSDNR